MQAKVRELTIEEACRMTQKCAQNILIYGRHNCTINGIPYIFVNREDHLTKLMTYRNYFPNSD